LAFFMASSPIVLAEESECRKQGTSMSAFCPESCGDIRTTGSTAKIRGGSSFRIGLRFDQKLP
jgi:hypothetical protein